LIRSSLGQSANIGDLYDARTDRFTGQSVVTRSAERLAINATPMEASQEESLVDDIVYDIASLSNEKELQLSIFLRMVEYVNIYLTRGALLRTVATLHEEVDTITDIQRLVSSNDDTISERATHVVVGVLWGATVAVCLDHNYTCDSSGPQLQAVLSLLQSGAQPNSQVSCDINNSYIISCFSNCLSPDKQLGRTSLENAVAMLSNLHRLIHSVNNGKGAPLSFILVPLSSLTECTTSVPIGIEEPLLTQTLKLFRKLTVAQYNIAFLSQYLDGHKNYLHEQEVSKIDEFLAGFQHAEKTLHAEIASAVPAVRSGHLEQSQLEDILRAFSRGGYSINSFKAFLDSLKPMFQKMYFYDELIHEGVIIIGHSQTDIHDITRGADVYILYATEIAKYQQPLVWEENSRAFLDTVRQEKRKHARTSGNINYATFAYIDCDVVRGVDIDREIAIYRYHHGKVASRDVAEERAVIASLNIAESSQKKQSFTVRPAKRAVVELPCPGASSKCGSSQRTWSCGVCKEQMEFGFDNDFYCLCGKAAVDTFSYKCSESNHGDDFLEFQPHVVKEHLGHMRPIRELNILFLGETGVGKSTWINGFANYISYSTLSEAENSDNVCLIPTKFTMTNENYKEVEIKTGTDKNENQQAGRSSTQFPKSYLFRRGRKGTQVRIIDTPGIGDTRGIDQDRINFQNIMNHISKLDEINGICILLKPNNARLTVMFSFCIKELLTHLHRDACKNIVFCFTNARSTFYKPGDTLPALRELIGNDTGIDLQLCRETIYCIDNESVRFLAALKQGIKFDDEEKKNYATSWETSVKETERLIDYISSLPPHKVKNTLSLNDARRLIVALSRPLAEITSTIQSNIGVIEQHRQDVLQSRKHKDDLTNKLYIPAIDLKTTPLDYPRTVCTSYSCVKHISIQGVQKIDYVSHCHPHCYLDGVQTNIVNCVALQHCAAMGGKLQCQHCGCSWSVHMHITYDCTQVQTQIVDENVERQIKDKATNIVTTEQHLKSLQDRINTLEAEKCQVAKVSAKFGCFLKHNAIAPFNDAISDYLDYLMQVEKGKISVGGDRSRLIWLDNMKSMYLEEVKILEQAISDQTSSAHVPTGEDIKRLYDGLCQLQITGPMLKDAMKVAEAADAGAMQYSERRIQAHRRQQSTRNSAVISEPRRGMADRFINFVDSISNRIWRP